MQCGLRNSWSLESGPLISRRVVCRGGSGTAGWVVFGTVSDAVVQRVRAKAAPCVLYSGPAPDAVTNVLDPDPGWWPRHSEPPAQEVAPHGSNFFSSAVGAPVPNVWTSVIKACTQPFFCPPHLAFYQFTPISRCPVPHLILFKFFSTIGNFLIAFSTFIFR
jgi:hypothetical protein